VNGTCNSRANAYEQDYTTFCWWNGSGWSGPGVVHDKLRQPRRLWSLCTVSLCLAFVSLLLNKRYSSTHNLKTISDMHLFLPGCLLKSSLIPGLGMLCYPDAPCDGAAAMPLSSDAPCAGAVLLPNVRIRVDQQTMPSKDTYEMYVPLDSPTITHCSPALAHWPPRLRLCVAGLWGHSQV